MCTPDCFFQRFIVNGKRFREYTEQWKRKVEQYYEQTAKMEERPCDGGDHKEV
jgi:hypothetical protein